MNKYPANIDLSQLPLGDRNNIVDSVKRSGKYYALESQVISSDIKTIHAALDIVVNKVKVRETQ